MSLGLGERVHVLPPVPEREVVGYAASADVGVSPAIPASLNDAYSLPNKLFQYMAGGIPVVASDFPHLRDIVSGSGAGLNVDARRPDHIAAALRQVLEDREAAAVMGRRAREAVLDRYNWQAAAKELLAVYADALADRS
jgi:glycosyltransferase involved in cell wall biosynthesis